MKIAVLTTDSREHYRDYDNSVPSFGAAPEALFQGFSTNGEIEVHVLSCLQERVQSPERLFDNVWYHGLEVPKFGWLRTGYQGCIRAVRRKLQSIQPHIVHGQGTERDCAMSAVLSGFPNVITIHGNMLELARLYRARMASFEWLSARLENFSLGRTGGVLCNSAYTENLVRPRAVRIWRVANPLRKEFFTRREVEIPRKRSVILNVGVICRRKRQRELLKMASRLHEKGHDFELHFIGNANSVDPYAAKFSEEICEAESKGYARFLGQKTTSELIKCFDSAGAMIHFPSEEAFGLVVAEALARNLKLFASRVGGLVDIAEGIPGAELFDLENWSGLENAIVSWLNSGMRCPTNVDQIMAQRYHPDVISAQHLNIYREVLTKPS